MIPFIEISLLIAVVKEFGFANAFFAWVVSLVLGFGLFRSSTLHLTVGVAKAIREGKSPGFAAVNGAMIGLAGVLFLLPGYFSDFCALILLLPFVRSYAANRLHRAFGAGATFTAGSARNTGPSTRPFYAEDAAHAVLDVDAVVVHPDADGTYTAAATPDTRRTTGGETDRPSLAPPPHLKK